VTTAPQAAEFPARAPLVSDWTRVGAPLAVVLLSALAFLPAFGAAFLNYDDQLGIELNRRFRGLDLEHLRWMFTTGKLGHYQPLSWVTLGADHALWGMDARGYHATNVTLHAACAAAVYLLALRLARVLRPAAPVTARARLAAAVAALAFAVHPLRVESVAWVTERRDVLSGLFFVLALIAWLRAAPGTRPGGVDARLAAAALGAAAAGLALLLGGLDLAPDEVLNPGPGGWPRVAAGGALLVVAGLAAQRALRYEGARPGARWVLLALTCLLLSLFAKAWGITLPALLLVLDGWPLRRASGGARAAAALLLEKLSFALVAAPFAVLAVWAQASQGTTLVGLSQHSPLERALQALHGLAFYPWKTLVPVGLVPFHDLPAELSLLEPRFGLSALAVVAATVALALGRARYPAALAAWLAYALIVAPVLGIAQSGPQLVAERYSYLACIPFALLLGGLVHAAGAAPGAGRRALGTLGPAALLVAWGVLTFAQTRHWTSSEALWSHTLRVLPDHPRASRGLAEVLRARALAAPDVTQRRALLFEALELLERGRARRDELEFDASLAAVYSELAELPGADPAQRARHVAAALEHARAALERASAGGHRRLASYHLAYGRCLLAAGQAQRALEPLQVHVRARPREALGWVLLGRAHEALGDRAGARAAYREALAREPGDAEVARRLRELGD
jgi:tetratricopeptide (TPR) repeat protein